MSRRPKHQLREAELVWKFFEAKPQGFFIDVGANDPEKGSQTWFLEHLERKTAARKARGKA